MFGYYKYPMEKPRINTIIKLQTLGLLGCEPRHGYDIITELEDKLERNVSASHVYPFLQKLHEQKLVEVEKEKGKKVYSLNKEGENFIQEVMGRCDDIIDFALQYQLTNCHNCGCKVYSGEHKEKIKGDEKIFCCCHCAESYKKS